MQRLSLLVSAIVFGASLSAQGCPERNLGIPLGGGDEAVFAGTPIGFAFPFGGTTYTDVHVCTNGFCFLSNGGVPTPGASDYTATQAELQNGSPRICVLWNDVNLTGANGGQVYIDSTPSRCTITWDRAVNYGMTTLFQLQLQLYPSGEMDMYWSEGATNNGTYNAASGVGICGVSPGGGATPTAPSDLSAFAVTNDDLTFEQWTVQTTFDMPEYGLHWIPQFPGWVVLPAPQGGCAKADAYGTGCISAQDSFYEVMAAGAIDLAGLRVHYTRTPNGYFVDGASAANYITPSLAAQIVANGDDVVQTVALASPMPVPGGGTTGFLTISSNGNIALAGTGNGGGFAPDVGNFLAFAQTSIAPSWHDYNPALAGSGKIRFEHVGGLAIATWEDVYTYNTAIADRFQVQFDLATGDMDVVYEVFGGADPNYLVGFSVAGASPPTEAVDISAALAGGIVIDDVAVQGLTLAANGLPLVGNAAFALDVSFAENLVPLGIMLFGDAPLPGIDLGFIGMAGCRAYSTANLTSATYGLTLPAGNGSLPFAIPAVPTLVGATVSTQAAAFSAQTQFGLVVSNGLWIEVGF